MHPKIAWSEPEKQLIRRYLLWCFKTTKEALEKIDRKATQLAVDYFIFDEINKMKWPNDPTIEDPYKKSVLDFKGYIDKKATEYKSQKFVEKSKDQVKPDYLYLKNRLWAIEKAVEYFLGKKELEKIQSLYETEMTQRILQSRDH